MRRKRRPTVNTYALQAEYRRITPDSRTPPLDEDPSPEALHFALIHGVVISHVGMFGIPEELQVHDGEKDIAIPRVSCYIVLVTQLAFQKINQLPTAFKNAVWQSIDDFHLNDNDLPDVLFLIVTHYIEEALEEVNCKELRNIHVSGRFPSGIASNLFMVVNTQQKTMRFSICLTQTMQSNDIPVLSVLPNCYSRLDPHAKGDCGE